MQTTLNNEQYAVLDMCHEVIREIKKAVIGKDEIIIKVMLSILAGGHVLIEDIPGVGKTTLALAFSKALSLDYKRVQFTPDVLPADITGFMALDRKTNTFEYKSGAAMTNLLLADEINRTSSKTQSALLEIMEEGKVTVDGVTHALPEPYIVIATQNPIGSVGTQSLPESQMDRFIMRLTMGYPSPENEIEMLKSKQSRVCVDDVNAVTTADEVCRAVKITEDIFVADPIFRYITDLACATRNSDFIKLGVSPRGAIALLKISKAAALLGGRDYVIPDDVLYAFKDVCAHRILLNSKAKINGITVSKALDKIMSEVSVPKIQRG